MTTGLDLEIALAIRSFKLQRVCMCWATHSIISCVSDETVEWALARKNSCYRLESVRQDTYTSLIVTKFWKASP
eukprot:scaffold122576_cov49-Attheya_sp.AAC.2